MITDSELLSRYARTGAEDAFAELVRRHVNPVYSAALRRTDGDVHRAAEVTQAVFIDLSRKAASLAGRCGIGGWLYLGVTISAARLARADRRWQTRALEAHAMDQLTSPSPAQDADWNQVRPVLDDALAELKDGERSAVVLRFFEGRSYPEIGAELRLSENSARMRVERALEKLQGLLARRGVTSTSTALAGVLTTQAVVAAPVELVSAATGAGLANFTLGASSLWTTFLMTKLQFGIVAGLIATAGLNVVLGTALYRGGAPADPVSDTGANREAASNAGIRSSVTLRSSVPQAGTRTVNEATVARLFEAGFSYDAVRAALIAELAAKNIDRFKVLFPADSQPYWSPYAAFRFSVDPQAERALNAELEAEVEQVLKAAGKEKPPTDYSLEYQTGGWEGIVSLERFTAYRKLSDDYTRKWNPLFMRSPLLEEDRAEYHRLVKEMDAAMSALFTEDELTELRIRTASSTFKNSLEAFTPTENEFRAVAKLQFAFNQKYGENALTPDQTRDRQAHLPELEVQIKEVLGEERYADYKLMQEPGASQLVRLTARYALPSGTPAEVITIQKETQARIAALRTDRTLSAEARRTQEAVLAKDVVSRVTAILGQKVTDAYKENGGTWLANLGPQASNQQ